MLILLSPSTLIQYKKVKREAGSTMDACWSSKEMDAWRWLDGGIVIDEIYEM